MAVYSHGWEGKKVYGKCKEKKIEQSVITGVRTHEDAKIIVYNNIHKTSI